MSESSNATVQEQHRELTSLDLFAGAGGLTAGLHAGSSRFRTVRAVEMDIEAAASYAENFGDVVYAGGIEQWLEEEDVPEVDLVVGGPPCQGFSPLGKQDANDTRNSLWQHYVETIGRAKPRVFLMENVPAFLKSPQFDIFSESFEESGPLYDYRFIARVLNSAEFGAAQVRKRVVVMGVHKDLDHPDFPMPAILEHPRTVRDAFEGITPFAGERDLPLRRVEFRGKVLRGSFKSSELHIGREYSDVSLERFRSIPYGGARFDLPEHLKTPCWKKHTTGSGDVMGRLTWEKPSVTIRTEFFKPEKGRYLHPTQHRAITHFEAARIQGFPDDYRFVGSKTSIARQIGNAVPIPLGSALGTHVASILD
ncbi:DNA cytosine methyltransferase [Terrabacter ginsenosidimutans]|uniref:Cytosine-specific methyltransferase n=1 Tax=Terrabacter ginsenosidimutans TaxID=490575 RepID=A0ABP7CU33_9MICO